MSDVIHSPQISRFEDGAAYLSYVESEGSLVIEHTIVPPDMEGRGVGGELVKAAVAYAHDKDLTLEATCSFARSWLERHAQA
jgi:predicted GNAT family acetyltransferase